MPKTNFVNRFATGLFNAAPHSLRAFNEIARIRIFYICLNQPKCSSLLSFHRAKNLQICPLPRKQGERSNTTNKGRLRTNLILPRVLCNLSLLLPNPTTKTNRSIRILSFTNLFNRNFRCNNLHLNTLDSNSR
jgi:hypothetical protein